MKKRIVLVLMAVMSLSMILSSFAQAQEESQMDACTAWSQQNDAYYPPKIAALQNKLSVAQMTEEKQQLNQELASVQAEYKADEDRRLASCER